MKNWIFQKISLGQLIFLAILGFLLGISLKNLSIEKITIGYEDYKLKKLKNDYNWRDDKIKKVETTKVETTTENFPKEQ